LRSEAGCAKPRLPSLESLPSFCTGCGSKAPKLPINLHSRTTEFLPTSGNQRPCRDAGVGAIAPGFAMLNRAKRASHIDPPASSYAIMRRAGPYRGENPGPGEDVEGELEPRPGIREQPGSNSAVSRFLRHGCFTPETGHCLARLARLKSSVNYESSAPSLLPKWPRCAKRSRSSAAEPPSTRQRCRGELTDFPDDGLGRRRRARLDAWSCLRPRLLLGPEAREEGR
jgi:hypothetical protein